MVTGAALVNHHLSSQDLRVPSKLVHRPVFMLLVFWISNCIDQAKDDSLVTFSASATVNY